MTKPQVQKKNEKIEPRTWSLKGFLQEIKRINNDMEDRRFAFILGAGASINSNIKGAAALAKEWMEMIYHREHKPMHDDYQSWLASNPLNFKGWEPNNLAKHYPQIFEQCFAGDHDSGYAALEKAIKDGKPSLGYAVLAWILSSTRHRMVVTTNFDNLVADAVSIYGGTYPHVIGHESLASYAKPLSRRPIVAKIHRDLFTDPINTCQGTGALEKSWVDTLKNIFRFYTPVFIGYGGNDGSLMDFLQSLDTEEISGQPFWCYYAPGDSPNDAIKQLMIKHNGVLVPSTGFDEFMLKMGEVVGFDRHKQITEIKNNSAQLINQIQEQMLSLNKETQDVEVKKILKPQVNEKQNWGWLDWQLHIDEERNIDKKDTLYLEAIDSLKDSYQLNGNYAVFLEEQEKPEDAKKYYLRAIEIEPNDADFLGNYAAFLKEQGKLEDAEEYYLRAIKIDPNHSNNLGNYAILLEEQANFEKAEYCYRKAIENEPDDPDFLGNYANFLQAQGKLEDAEQYYRRVIKIEPDNANYLGNYAILLKVQGRLEDAEHYYRQAINIEPDGADFLGNYANLLKIQGKLEDAEHYYRRAIDIDPNHSNSLENYAILLEALAHLEKAEHYYRRAIEIEPNNADFLGNYADFLKERERFEEANEVIQQALAIAPNDERLLNIKEAIQSNLNQLEEETA